LTSEGAEATQTEAFSAGFTDIFNRHEMADLGAYLQRHQEKVRPVEGRILYIEDSISQQLSMMAFLKESGLEVDAYSDAESAWQAFQEGHYDLVLTDIVLPGAVSGLHLVHRIRRIGGDKGDIPIVAITGYDDPSRRVELLQRGVNDYVLKPVIHHEVLVRLKTLLKSSQLITQLKEQSQKIEQQSKDQLTFLASISHDVRTPLNGILGIMELIRSDDMTEQHQAWLKTAMQSGDHLVSIIDDVLDLSRAEVDEFAIDSKPMDVKQIVTNVVMNLKPQADCKHIALNLTLADNFPRVFKGDPKRFYQVVMNLVGNAIKFTEKGSVDLELEYLPSAFDETQGSLVGVIKDSGVGIPQAQCDTIFQKFQQVDATARSKGGSGLGLAIVKTIVDAWKGQLGVESKRGEGSRFWFSLPIETLDMKALNAAETRQKVAFGEKMKVLLVEDNEINQLVAGGMLDQLKLEYDIAENGKEALDRLHENAYDVVLMDCQMPVMDGYEATASIRHSSQSFNNVYIIALTASAMVEEERKCYRMGMNDFVAKPVIMDSMIRALNKAYCVIQD
jgi:signal transduction histidine kinase